MCTIVTLTFNPCIDKSTTVESLLPDKKLYCQAFKNEAGGGGINVARALKYLGYNDFLAVYLAGGHTGVILNSLLDEEKIKTKVVNTGVDTRENIMITDKASNLQYRFITPGIPIKQTHWRKCLKIIRGVKGIRYIIVSGSMQTGYPKEIFILLADIACQKGAKLIIDIPARTIQTYPIKNAFLLKPNLNELSLISGKEELRGDNIIKAAKDIILKSISKVVVVSMGAAGALLVTSDMIKQFIALPVKRKSTVGAGDSMVAGIVMQLSAQKSIIDAVQFGIACGTAVTMNEGSRICNRGDAENLYNSMIKG